MSYIRAAIDRLGNFLLWVALFLTPFAIAVGAATPQRTTPAASCPPPGGYWGSAGTPIPCWLVKPYTQWPLPPGSASPGALYYLRYDTAVSPVVTATDGLYAGEGGADHTTQHWLDNTIIPIASGALADDGFPAIIYPPPYRDVPVPNRTYTLCQRWKELNGPRATAACPSNQTIPQYANSVAQKPQWTGPWGQLQPVRNQQCNQPLPTCTPTPGGPTPTPAPPTPTPGPPGANAQADYIEAIYNLGITAGCGGNNFCPNGNLTRGQAAVWIWKAMHPNELPPKCAGVFNDVPCAP